MYKTNLEKMFENLYSTRQYEQIYIVSVRLNLEHSCDDYDFILSNYKFSFLCCSVFSRPQSRKNHVIQCVCIIHAPYGTSFSGT